MYCLFVLLKEHFNASILLNIWFVFD